MLRRFIFNGSRFTIIIGIMILLVGAKLSAQQPDISVTPNSLSDSLFTGEISKQWFTIANTGVSDLTFDISIEGVDSIYALEFDGVDDYVEVPDHFSLSAIGGAFTLEFWMNVGEYPFQNYEVLGKWGTGWYVDDEYAVDFHSTGILEMTISGSSGLTKIFSDTMPYSWTHVAGVFDSTSTSLKLFINGTLESNVTPSTLTMDRDTDQPFRMGTYDFGFYPNFKGQLDEVRIWNVARTQTEIQADMYRELTGSEPGLVGYWKFNEGSGDITFDYSSNNNDGTLYGGVAWVDSPIPITWLFVTPTSDTVPADSSINIEVTFDARYLVGGDYETDIVISSNDPEEPEVIVPTHLHVTGMPDIAVSEDTLDYGIVFIGTPVTDTLIVSNEGTDLLTIGDISSDNSDYTVDITSFSLSPGENQEVLVTLTLNTVGFSTGTLTITSDDPDESTITIALQGEGADPPDISVTPDSLSDGLFTGEISKQWIIISNDGVSDLTFDISIEREDSIALEFDGSDDWVEVPDNSSLRLGTSDFSLSAWIKTSDTGSENCIISKKKSGTWQGFRMIISSNGQITPQLYVTTDEDVGSIKTVNDGVWHHVAGVFDRDTDIKIYIDGLLDNTKTTDNSGDMATDRHLMIGRYENNVDLPIHYFNGIIDEVRIWNVARTQTEIQADMYRELTGSELGLVSYWKFNEGSGDTAFDYSSNDNDGTFHGGVEWIACPEPSTWLSVMPTSDTVITGSLIYIEVTFDARYLVGGNYETDIVISSNDPDEQKIIIPVYLTVMEAGIDEDTVVQKPKRYELHQNYPNPFVNSTELKYALPKDANINITIYNLAGQIVTTLVDEKRNAGYHTIKWDGRNKLGRQVASGVYFYRLKAENYTVIKKMNLIR